MPSKEPAKGLKPYTVFHVAASAPEDIHTDTVLARTVDDARAIAADQHRDSVILYVRGVGETAFEPDTRPTGQQQVTGTVQPLPGARFINGRFLATSISDDPILDTAGE